MVKTVLSVAHIGLKQWIIQRLSAIYMAVFLVGLIAFIMFNADGLTFPEWHYLFSQGWVKIATLLFLYLLAQHTWVGMWTILTDYVKWNILRMFLEVLVSLTLIGCFLWGLFILWSV